MSPQATQSSVLDNVLPASYSLRVPEVHG